MGIDSTGINKLDSLVDPGVYSRMALTEYHTPDEAIMWAQLPWTQFPLRDYIKIRIRLRRGEAPSGEAPIFTINATSIKRSPGTEYDQGERRDHFSPGVEPDAPPTLFQQDVIANELGNEYINKYDWFESNLIPIGEGCNFDFNIIWSGNADLFIDKIMVYNYDYKVLYVDKNVSIADIAFDLKRRYPVESVSSDPYFQSFYFDEPSQLSAQFRGKLQDTISHIYASSQDFEINSAVGGSPKHFLDFDKEYAKSEEDSTIFKKYLLYNMYPIDKNTNIGTTSLQKRFDLFCNYNNVNDVMGSPYDPDRYKYVGLLNAQLAAKEANIPFVMTLGVHSEQYVKKNADGSLSLVEGVLTRRQTGEK